LPNDYFSFKQFTIQQAHAGMKVTTEACLFGAWVAIQLNVPNAQVLDIGTGTGLLSCMIAQVNNNYCIDAIEIDEQAITDAQHNIKALPFHNNITVIHEDITTISFKKKYDYIICNPPFFKESLLGPNTLKNKALHEHNVTINHLLQIMVQCLSNNGKAFILFPYNRLQELQFAISRAGLHIHTIINIHQTTTHKNPFRVFIILGAASIPVTLNAIYIKTDNQYTDEFKKLLQPYYLYL
jgi:tRNA1Val (adenine37-N6)-methyltransferase